MSTKSTQLTAINLDANASVPPLKEATEALLTALELQGNASSPHALGRKLRTVMDEAREHVALALGGRDKELFFCSGASEGNRWIVDSIVCSGRERGRPFKVLASPLEHPSLLKCLLAAAQSGGIHLEILEIQDRTLRMDPTLLRSSEVLFVTAAHNETGYLPDLRAISELISDQTILVADAAQAVARIPCLPKRVDAIVASAHKMGGVVGAGAVLLRGNARKLSAPWTGGGQEAGLRAGSESVPLIAAMGQAARDIEQTRSQLQDLKTLRHEIESDLLKAWPFSFTVGDACERLPQTIAICLNGLDAEGLRIAIDQAGVCVGFGSACSALAPEPSPALLAFGLTPSQARATIRISLSTKDSQDRVRLGVDRLKAAVNSLLVSSKSNDS